MTLKIYNTQSRKKEEFLPLRDNRVGIYVCGITAYDFCHVGHARSAVVFDVMVSYLRYRGYDVTYVKNFTDIDDKIIEKAKREGSDIKDIAERYILEHDEDMQKLHVATPDFTPRATENIEGMIHLVSTLLDKGLAYAMDGDVYYSVQNFPEYGKLSGRNIEEMMAGARIDVNEKKKNPLDFTLWKASKEGEPWWESPWGKGRPGWHIECSVMSQRYLGETLDIHGGGEDLIFPHHENEIAQSEGATGKPFSRYWLHNGFVRVNSEKMSKSLGNFFTIRDILAKYHPEVLRFFLLQSHYRSPVDFSDAALNEARQGMNRFYTTLKAVQDVSAVLRDDSGEKTELAVGKEAGKLRKQFVEAMDDDFNTARAVGHLFDTARFLNAQLSGGKKATISPEEAVEIKNQFLEIGKVLGIFFEDPEAYLLQDRERETKKRNLNVAEIGSLIAERNTARSAKDWQKADDIRKKLTEMGISIRDTADETTWAIE
jgi:cysteinyl-tRNA synthetase